MGKSKENQHSRHLLLLYYSHLDISCLRMLVLLCTPATMPGRIYAEMDVAFCMGRELARISPPTVHTSLANFTLFGHYLSRNLTSIFTIRSQCEKNPPVIFTRGRELLLWHIQRCAMLVCAFRTCQCATRMKETQRQATRLQCALPILVVAPNMLQKHIYACEEGYKTCSSSSSCHPVADTIGIVLGRLRTCRDITSFSRTPRALSVPRQSSSWRKKFCNSSCHVPLQPKRSLVARRGGLRCEW